PEGRVSVSAPAAGEVASPWAAGDGPAWAGVSPWGAEAGDAPVRAAAAVPDSGDAVVPGSGGAVVPEVRGARVCGGAACSFVREERRRSAAGAAADGPSPRPARAGPDPAPRAAADGPPARAGRRGAAVSSLGGSAPGSWAGGGGTVGTQLASLSFSWRRSRMSLSAYSNSGDQKSASNGQTSMQI